MKRIFTAVFLAFALALISACSVLQPIQAKFNTDVQAVTGPDLNRGVEIANQRNLPEGVTCAQGLLDYEKALPTTASSPGAYLAPNGLVSLAIAGAADANSFNPQTFALPPLDPAVKKACLLVLAEDRVGLLKLSAIVAGIAQGKGVVEGVSALKAAQAAIATGAAH